MCGMDLPSHNFFQSAKYLFKKIVYACKFVTQSKYIREAERKQKQRPKMCGMNTVSCVCQCQFSAGSIDPIRSHNRGPILAADLIQKWLPIKNYFVSIKISLANLGFSW